jgi:hypothetical protein
MGSMQILRLENSYLKTFSISPEMILASKGQLS